MKTYYIFSIKKDIYNIFKRNKKSLYKTLYNLYGTKKENIYLGLSIYNEICNIIEKNKIKKYIQLLPINKNINNKYIIEKSLIIIKPSSIIIKNIELKPDIIYTLNNYNKYLFICDFKNNKYCWLNEL